MAKTRVKGKGREIFLGEKASKPEKQLDSKTASRQAVKPARQQVESSEKVTLYLPSDLIAQLDEVWAGLRRRYKKERKVSKSEIVRIALQRCLRDWADLESFPKEELPPK